VVRQQEIVGGRYSVLVAYVRGADGQISALSFDAANSHVTGTVRYEEPVFGAGIEPSRFEFPFPPGAQIRTLD
jgi:outer membrane lipoprotein-sorting protein